ncbi:MAG: transposase [Gammaproteobacteria bacterium]|jgi:TnpA family transposase|nr:transposase [Gammaproteobacteria bacterium]
MPKVAILSSLEQRRFDSPPKFSADDRPLYFSLTKSELNLVKSLRMPTNKVGFALQLGYFKANGKFFPAEQFHQQDIKHVVKMLGMDPGSINLLSYKKKIPTDHRRQILLLLGWQPFNDKQWQKAVNHIEWLVQKQFSPKAIFLSMIDFFWQNKTELPSYNALSTLITDAYNAFEAKLINILESKLTQLYREKLNQLVYTPNGKSMERPTITLIKQVNQSLNPSDIQENVNVFKEFKNYFYEFQPIISELNLSDQATEYFATWVQKSTAFQLSQFNNKNKIYLHLLCYIKHNFYYRHDILIDIFLKSVGSVSSAAEKKLHQLEKENRSEHNKAIKKLSRTSQDSRELIDKITEIIKSPLLLESEKLSKIEISLNHYHAEYGAIERQRLVQLEKSLNEESNNQALFNTLELLSLKIQRKVSSLVKVLELNPDTSSSSLIDAILYFKLPDGNTKNAYSAKDEHDESHLKKPIPTPSISEVENDSHKASNNPPICFLKADEKKEIYAENGKIRVSLYKILLFIHMKEAIKSGSLNFLYSYRYKAIHEYLIDEESWKSTKEDLLVNAGLSEFYDFNETINNLKKQLNEKYQITNERLLNGSNNHVTIDKGGKIKVSTPKIDSDDTKYVSFLLSQSGFVPILQVLSDINSTVQFTDSFKHFSIKHKKMKPEPKTIFAGIIGKGCNIGINRIASISVGISGDILRNTVNWHFNLKNVQNANDKIISFLNKLSLANAFRHDFSQLHTGSDGRKINVAVSSLLASYSFKYFGKGKGVSIYTFLDERHLLFYSTVISASEREAAYVIDGLLQNEVIKSTIHSTDTHGFMETIFAASHLISTAFAPRIKNIGDQKIYGFSTKGTYEKRGYKILPSRIINLKLIKDNWDDILRFMATIKLKNVSASQLFKRLSSYAKDHPLYKALKEFGRIIKSIFILTYFDDVMFRQRIEKQLNKVENSNKFSKAVFFSNNQEFKEGTKEEQELSTACKVLIQNTIILWNYLYLSQLIANNSNIQDRNQMVVSIKKGSLITWQHVNLQGEYDFTKHTGANDNLFNIEQILALKVAHNSA